METIQVVGRTPPSKALTEMKEQMEREKQENPDCDADEISFKHLDALHLKSLPSLVLRKHFEYGKEGLKRGIPDIEAKCVRLEQELGLAYRIALEGCNRMRLLEEKMQAEIDEWRKRTKKRKIKQ